MAKTYVIKTAQGSELAMKVGDLLTGGFWKWKDGEEKQFTVKGPIAKGSVFAKSGISTAPDILPVTDLKDGVDKRILVGSVLLSTLTEQFPNDAYVGKSFLCVQGPPAPGTRYKTMMVRELVPAGPDDVDETPEAPAPAKSKKK